MLTGLVVVATANVTTACLADDGPDRLATPAVDPHLAVDSAAELLVVGVESQSCARPQTRRGIATYVADGVVLTAAHVVEGDLRRLVVGGEPGRVLVADARLDLALVGVGEDHLDDPADIEWRSDLIGRPAGSAAVALRSPSGERTVELLRELTLRVDDLSAGEVHERPAVELDVFADPGDSGTPVIDENGRLIAVIVLRRPGRSTSYATVVPSDLAELLRDVTLAPSPGCV